MGILDIKELTADVMKSGVNMEHPSGRFIIANECMIFLLIVKPGHLCFMALICITAIRWLLGLNWVIGFLEILLTEIERHVLILWTLLKYKARAQSLLPFIGCRPPNREW